MLFSFRFAQQQQQQHTQINHINVSSVTEMMGVNNAHHRGGGGSSSGQRSSLFLVQSNLRLFIFFLFFLAGCRSTSGATCEQIRIPMCRSMPYNVTQIPNLLHHSNQLNALLVLDQYQPLVATNCSGVLLFFLCALFTPVCPINFSQEVIPPCQDVCLRAKKGCEPVLAGYNVTWPTDLSCDDLPPYETGVCISPEAINSSPIKKGRMILKRKAKHPVDAAKDKKPRRQNAKDCSFSLFHLNRRRFAGKTQPLALDASSALLVRGTLLKVESYSKGKINLTFAIRDVYRSPGLNLTVNETIEVETSSRLLVRKLRRCGLRSIDSYRLNRDYLVLAEVEKVQETAARITCAEDCVVQPWRKSLHKTAQNWSVNRRRMKSNVNYSPTTSKPSKRKKSIRQRQQEMEYVD